MIYRILFIYVHYKKFFPKVLNFAHYPKNPPENPRNPKTSTTATAEHPMAIHVLLSSQSSLTSLSPLSPVQSSHKWSKSHVKCRLHDVEFSNSDIPFWKSTFCTYTLWIYLSALNRLPFLIQEFRIRTFFKIFL